MTRRIAMERRADQTSESTLIKFAYWAVRADLSTLKIDRTGTPAVYCGIFCLRSSPTFQWRCDPVGIHTRRGVAAVAVNSLFLDWQDCSKSIRGNRIMLLGQELLESGAVCLDDFPDDKRAFLRMDGRSLTGETVGGGAAHGGHRSAEAVSRAGRLLTECPAPCCSRSPALR